MSEIDSQWERSYDGWIQRQIDKDKNLLAEWEKAYRLFIDAEPEDYEFMQSLVEQRAKDIQDWRSICDKGGGRV
jgi:hypothetical protein